MDLLEAGTAQLERVVTPIPPEAWRNPTPCEMTVREVEPHFDDMREMGAFGNSSGNLPMDASTQTRLLDAFGRQD